MMMNNKAVKTDGRNDVNHARTDEGRCLVLFDRPKISWKFSMNLSRVVLVIATFLTMISVESVMAVPELPDFSAATFSNILQIDNPYWPMVPGTIWTYEGESTDPKTGETETEAIIVEVLNETRTISGVENRILRDRVFLEGILIEDAFDWYAQDDGGNVWYMGEDLTDFDYDENGMLIGTSHPGAWETGVDGAVPGHIMKANPKIGQNYYRELYAGVAEDEGTILALGESVTVPAGSFDSGFRVLDSSDLFPETGHKSYAPGVGSVKELDFDADGNHVGTVELVSVVPEPGRLVLVAAGSLGLLAFRRHRRC